MPDSEREYVELIYEASEKYAAWDPEIPVAVGDWGRITRGGSTLEFWRKDGIFLKEGNIYTDGKAKTYGIPDPVEHGGDAGEGQYWVTSQNAEAVDLSTSAGGISPAIAQCKVKAAYKFTSGHAAVLVMDNDSLTSIDAPGAFRRLLADPAMHERVLVSEVHRTASYARLLTDHTEGTVSIGLSVVPPVPVAGIPSGTADASWTCSTVSGNFKSHVNKTGAREFYPLFRLVSLTETRVSRGLCAVVTGNAPLPNAVPPWAARRKGIVMHTRCD
ncbi:hypothetical protein C8R43DRAFT_1182903 [Mycena crocata]|nr:hypothetical protein C8R43DRAFT_1182903 [Mycena crocata]